MSIVPTHRPAPVSIEAAKILQARGITVAGVVFDGFNVADPHADAKAKAAARVKDLFDLFDNVEGRVGKLDGKQATGGDIFPRLKELDARVTARESVGPATQGGLGNTTQPNSGARTSPTELPNGQEAAPSGRSPYSGKPIVYSGIDPDAPSNVREAQKQKFQQEQLQQAQSGDETEDEGSVEISALYRSDPGTAPKSPAKGPSGSGAGLVTLDTALDRAKAVLARSTLVTPDPRIVAAEAIRITARAEEFAANRKALRIGEKK